MLVNYLTPIIHTNEPHLEMGLCRSSASGRLRSTPVVICYDLWPRPLEVTISVSMVNIQDDNLRVFTLFSDFAGKTLHCVFEAISWLAACPYNTDRHGGAGNLRFVYKGIKSGEECQIKSELSAGNVSMNCQ
jgi:hypothetical protein